MSVFAHSLTLCAALETQGENKVDRHGGKK